MGYDKRSEKIKYFLLKKRFYFGLLVLLPAFFSIFALGAFLPAISKLESLLKLSVIQKEQFVTVYTSIIDWAIVFTLAALLAGLIVGYALIRPAKRLLSKPSSDVEEFGVLGSEFKGIAISMTRYFSALESLTGGVITLDSSGIITMANSRVRQILGLPDGQIEHKNITDLLDVKDQLEKIADGSPIATELEYESSVGRKTLEVEVSPIIGTAGVKGAVVAIRDISGILEIEERMRKTERLAAVGMLAVTVAHEVRNPLASIRGFAQLMSEDLKNDDPRKPYLDTIIKETDRLNRVVDSLYEQRDSAFEAEPLKDLLSRIRLLCSHFETEKSATVSIDFDDKTEDLMIDDERVFHAIYNVALNAFEAIDSGGSVKMRSWVQDGLARVSVDSDSALDPSVRDRVFENDVSTKGKRRGSGMGIAKSAIEQAGGAIDVASQDRRTVFTVTLPKRKQAGG